MTDNTSVNSALIDRIEKALEKHGDQANRQITNLTEQLTDSERRIIETINAVDKRAGDNLNSAKEFLTDKISKNKEELTEKIHETNSRVSVIEKEIYKDLNQSNNKLTDGIIKTMGAVLLLVAGWFLNKFISNGGQ